MSRNCMDAALYRTPVAAAMLLLPVAVNAYDVNDVLSIELTATGVAQYAEYDDVFRDSGAERDDDSRGAFVTDIGVNLHPTDVDEFQFTVSFAEGNGLNALEATSLAPYADDLEDDLEDINGDNRDHLLEAWYKHTFTVTEASSLGISVGIIDSTGYLDDNAFANDEVGQFMNDTFVNSTLANLPSYDLGGALEFESGAWHARAVVMSSENDDESYMYYGAQIGVTTETALGEGNYRVYAHTTSDDFAPASGTSLESLSGVGVSFDQQLDEIFGAFGRVGWQDDDAAVDHDVMVSGGISISGSMWGRNDDDAGIGLAWLNGADAIDETLAVEAYARFQLTAHTDFTLDLQYIEDDYAASGADDPQAFIVGARINAYF